MIRICLNVKSQWAKQIEVFSQGTDDSKNLRCETLYIGNYEYVNISSFAVLAIKLMLEATSFPGYSHEEYPGTRARFLGRILKLF